MYRAIVVAFLFLVNSSQAKTFLIPLQNNHVSAKDKLFADVRGGDTLMLQAGARGGIQFADFEGIAGDYITINTAGPLCEIREKVLPYGISLRNCHYVRLAGNGSEQNEYRIKIAEVSHDGAGLGISDKSDHIEICYIEICATKGPGILCKTNPDCLTYRETYTASNFSIHHNYVHNTGTEGMYIGSTAFEGVKMKCGEDTVIRLPSLLKNVEVYDNSVAYTGWDGIQISNTIDAKCYHNTIDFDSQKDEPWQNCGLIIGGGTSGKFYNNIISGGKGFPINCFGTGKVEITGNHIMQETNSTKTAIYVNDKLADNRAHYIISKNSIDTKHFPAIHIINKKQRRPDLIKDNVILQNTDAAVILYEGVKPVLK